MKNNIVLIVDDVEINRMMLADLFSNDYGIMEAANGEEAMTLIGEHYQEFAIVLLDIVMPEKDGYDVLDFMHFNRYLNDIPVVMISASESEAAEIECLKRGASDFIIKPFNPNIVKQRVRNVIELFRYKRSLERIISEQTEKFRGITEFVIDVLVNVMQVKNSDTRRSTQRVRAYTREVLNFIYDYCDEKYGLTPQKIELISASSILHDIGQLVIPENLIGKTIQLTDEERRTLEAHTSRGCQIIESMNTLENREYIDMALEICRYHHERWDGSGYPEKMVGDEIPISAQVVGVADTYDSLRSGVQTGRKYTHEEALGSIERGDFGMFSPVLVESCKMMADKLDEIYEQYKD
ncbi:response regulator [Christensenellaceae bacterium OttesenSCG-928-K19]|nr:response regulator [Christensenellaceae bacterium OttesenSCG-928-K19]